MKVLAIGNSFSQDATRYLHQVAKAAGVDMKVMNLCIGGCSLKKHYDNMRTDATAYALEYNGEKLNIFVSMRNALVSDDWDVITLQQVSSLSFDKESYEPYLPSLAEYVRFLCPNAKLCLHQTWFYEDGSEKLAHTPYATSADMLRDIKAAYSYAADLIGADLIIPSAEAFEYLYSNGCGKIHRDTFHASLGIGRYTLALTWLEALTGISAIDNGFRDFDLPMSEDEISLCRSAAHYAVGKAGKLISDFIEK